MNASARKLVKNVESIVSLPEVFVQIDKLINSPESNLTDIANVISLDPGLATRLLKIANSALFNFPTEIDSITRAISVIGTRQLRDLVLATEVISVFEKVDSKVDMESFWRHSIATGIVARLLASYRREANVEYYYLLGLLHEVGMLVMYMEIPDDMGKILAYAKENDVSMQQAELSVMGFDHCHVGAALMAYWNLPERIQSAVNFHHHPSLSLNGSIDASVVHVADLIANALELGNSGEMDVPQFDEQAWESLELSHSILPDVVSQLEYQYCDAVKLFLDEV